VVVGEFGLQDARVMPGTASNRAESWAMALKQKDKQELDSAWLEFGGCEG
jgi:hypothetical protein